MSQQPASDFDIVPTSTSGTQLATYLNNLNGALLSMRSGTSLPPSAEAGTVWRDTTSGTTHIVKYYNGTVSVELYSITVATGAIVFRNINNIDSSIAISDDGSALFNDDGTDNNNIGIGFASGYGVTSGVTNTLVGYNSGREITTGNNNTAVGAGAMRGLSGTTTGSYNIAHGYYSSARITTGEYNVAVGYFAGTYTNAAKSTNLETLNNTICIGQDSYATASGEMSLGNSSYITAAYTAATFSQRSDERYKNFQDMDLGLEFINSIEPKKFTWKEGADTESINYGFSAQQVKRELEKLDDNNRTMHKMRGDEQNLSYTEFVAPLVKAIQELSKTNDSLLKRIELLETK